MRQATPDVGIPAGAPIPNGTLARIRSMLPGLTPGDRRIADYLLAAHQQVTALSVSDIAATVGCSTASIVRCCQRLGFKGFHELKLALVRESGLLAQLVTGEVAEDDAPATILHKTFAFQCQAFTESLATLDDTAFTTAVELLAGAQRVLFVGIGTSSPLAHDAAHRFQTIGVHAEAAADGFVEHVKAGLLGPQDVCCAVSHTGASRETVASVRAAGEAGARTIAITSFARSPLTELVDIALIAGCRETAYRLEAMTSRSIHLLVLDSLCIATGLRLGDRARVALDKYSRIIAEHKY